MQHLSNQIDSHGQVNQDEWMDGALLAVDGLAGAELRRLVSLDERRSMGAFFTSKELARKVLTDMAPNLNAKSVVYDPACGAGNLLLSIADFFKGENIKPVSKHFLLGTDLQKEFVDATKNRIAIKELIFQATEVDNKFPLFNRSAICQADGMVDNSYFKIATHIFVNPPFNLIPAASNIDWSKGVVSAAALFIDRIIEFINPETSIIAILPDVLRSGSRYHAWRGRVLKSCDIERIMLYGQFDEHADVDVFAVSLRKRTVPRKKIDSGHKFQRTRKQKLTIEELFTVSVGPVVDNRDKHEGRYRGYIVSKGLEGWIIQSEYSQTRRHTGRYFKGPFVVIKRTSRMGDSQRAIATIINTPSPVYVDNHLIVLVPKSGTLSDCRNVISSLKDSRTDDWLNREIRCRHLTVKIVARIPVWQ